MKERTANATRLKARINNYAKQKNLPSQVVLQNYMFECLLNKISHSRFADNFIIKGGLLISSIVGLETRTTMDMDATLVHMTLSEESILNAMREITDTQTSDNVSFNILSLEAIRKNDVYGGFCLRIDALYESILTSLSVDISTGDSIVPAPMDFGYHRIFDPNEIIPIHSYPIETILAEKLETIITRSVLNSRPRDFYDVYILTKTVPFDKASLKQALLATAEHRHTREIIEKESQNRLAVIESSVELQMQWKKYQAKFKYAKNISFEDTVRAVRDLFSAIGKA